MLPKFERLSNILEDKIILITDAIEKSDPTKPEFKELLLNFDASMSIKNNLDAVLEHEKLEKSQCYCEDDIENLKEEN